MKKIIAIGVVLCCVFVLLTGCFGGGKVKATITTNSGETKEMTLDERYALLSPIDSLFSDLESITLPPFFEKLSKSGQMSQNLDI